MKKVFTHENRMILFNLRNLLRAEGIETVVVNEYAAGGIGDLPAFDTWPELWVEDETRFTQAQAIVRDVMHEPSRQDWYCRGCREKNAAAFQLCWNCGRAAE